jgi:hypothetical protein
MLGGNGECYVGRLVRMRLEELLTAGTAADVEDMVDG